jgi:hypothetical protein
MKNCRKALKLVVSSFIILRSSSVIYSPPLDEFMKLAARENLIPVTLNRG